MIKKPFVYVLKFSREEEENTESTLVLVTTEQNEIDEAILKLRKDLDDDYINDWIHVETRELNKGRKVILFQSDFGDAEVIIEVDIEYISFETAKTISKQIEGIAQ